VRHYFPLGGNTDVVIDNAASVNQIRTKFAQIRAPNSCASNPAD
jgi:hypothetical protein